MVDLGEQNMNVYLLHRTNTGPYLAFGENAVEAAESLCAVIGGDTEDLSVSGSWKMGEVINLGKLWPFFTNNPQPYMIEK